MIMIMIMIIICDMGYGYGGGMGYGVWGVGYEVCGMRYVTPILPTYLGIHQCILLIVMGQGQVQSGNIGT